MPASFTIVANLLDILGRRAYPVEVVVEDYEALYHTEVALGVGGRAVIAQPEMFHATWLAAFAEELRTETDAARLFLYFHQEQLAVAQVVELVRARSVRALGDHFGDLQTRGTGRCGYRVLVRGSCALLGPHGYQAFTVFDALPEGPAAVEK